MELWPGDPSVLLLSTPKVIALWCVQLVASIQPSYVPGDQTLNLMFSLSLRG